MHSLDINFYFKDNFGRLCVAASAGGILPKFLLNDNESMTSEKFNENMLLNEKILSLSSIYDIGINPIISSILQYQYPEKVIEFPDFEITTEFDFTLMYESKFSNMEKNYIEKDINNNDDYNDYFYSFKELAKKGLYVYDKLNINIPNDDTYILVAYPIYTKNTYSEFYNNLKDLMKSSPKINKPIISKTNSKIYNSSFKKKKLIDLLNNHT